jgi:transcriptional regulator with XRE-family HTH domain
MAQAQTESPLEILSMGWRIQWARKRRGLSREELGELVGKSAETIGRYERDEIPGGPPAHTLRLIAISLQTSADFLVGLKQSATPSKNSAKRRRVLTQPVQPPLMAAVRTR